MEWKDFYLKSDMQIMGKTVKNKVNGISKNRVGMNGLFFIANSTCLCLERSTLIEFYISSYRRADYQLYPGKRIFHSNAFGYLFLFCRNINRLKPVLENQIHYSACLYLDTFRIDTWNSPYCVRYGLFCRNVE